MNASRNSRYPISTRRINAAGKMIGGHNRAENGDTYIETSPKRSRKVARQRLTSTVNHTARQNIGTTPRAEWTAAINIISYEMNGTGRKWSGTKAEVIAALNTPTARRMGGIEIHGNIGKHQEISGEMSRGDILRLLANL